VVELGFGEGSEEGGVRVVRGEVEEGSGDGGGGEVAVDGDVRRSQGALMQSRPCRSRTLMRSRKLDLGRRRCDQLPSPGRGAVTQERARARSAQGGNEETVLGDVLRRERRIDAEVEAVQPARAQGTDDRRSAHPGRQQLRAGDDRVLI
jgi:hypothetical protein